MRRAALVVIMLAALAACSNNAKSNAGGSPQPAGNATSVATPDCHGDTVVWTLERTKVYMTPSDPHYGNTKHGSYMCLADARNQGYRHARGYGRRQHRRHRGALTP